MPFPEFYHLCSVLFSYASICMKYAYVSRKNSLNLCCHFIYATKGLSYFRTDLWLHFMPDTSTHPGKPLSHATRQIRAPGNSWGTRGDSFCVLVQNRLEAALPFHPPHCTELVDLCLVDCVRSHKGEGAVYEVRAGHLFSRR
jgi:hypothetical protein